MFPARGQRIERNASPKVHHSHDRPAIGFQHVASPVPKMPNDKAGGGDKRNPSKQGVSSSPSCPAPFSLSNGVTRLGGRNRFRVSPLARRGEYNLELITFRLYERLGNRSSTKEYAQLGVSHREARANRQCRQLIDRIAAGALIGKLLFIESLGHVRVPFARDLPDHRAGVELTTIDAHRAAEAAADIKGRLDNRVEIGRAHV